jgi:NADH-quinone oxidoreductase subunit E
MWIIGRTRLERERPRHVGVVYGLRAAAALVRSTVMLSADALKRIDREIAKYPPEHRQSAVIAALAIAQDEHAWLSTETMDFVAHYLGMPPIAVYEVATFYEMFDTEPTGKYKLTICTNLPCALSSAAQAAAHLKQKLGIGFGETTADGLFTLKEGECFGACGDAPVVLVNNKRMCSWMKPEQLDGLIAELSAEAKR